MILDWCCMRKSRGETRIIHGYRVVVLCIRFICSLLNYGKNICAICFGVLVYKSLKGYSFTHFVDYIMRNEKRDL